MESLTSKLAYLEQTCEDLKHFERHELRGFAKEFRKKTQDRLGNLAQRIGFALDNIEDGIRLPVPKFIEELDTIAVEINCEMMRLIN